MSSGAQDAQLLFPTGTDIYSTKLDFGTAITGESQTIPSVAAYTLFLDYAPQSGTVSIPGFTEVGATPGLNQFAGIYSGTNAGLMEFNGANGGSAITVSYTAAGDRARAVYFNDLQDSVVTIENYIISGLGITGTFLALAGGQMIGNIVMNGADIVPLSSGSSSLGSSGVPFSSITTNALTAQTISDASSTATISFGPSLATIASNSGVSIDGDTITTIAGGNSELVLQNGSVAINAPSSQLSILVTGTNIAGSVLPSITSVYNLGSSGSRWGTIFADAISTPGFDTKYVARAGDSMLGNLSMGTGTLRASTITNGNSSSINITSSGDTSVGASSVNLTAAYDINLNAPGNILLGTTATASPLQLLMSAEIQADTASAYDIGSAGFPFKTIYADNVVGANFSGNFVARSGDSMEGDLVMSVGATGTQPTIYTENIAALSGVGILNIDTGQLNVTAQNNMAFNIGSSGIQKLQIGASEIYFSDNFLPSSGDAYDLGGPSNYIRDAYIRNLHASGLASGTNLTNAILTDPILTGTMTTLPGAIIGTSGTPLGTLWVDNIITNASTGVYVAKAGDSMLGNLTFTGTANILSASSGTTDIGTAANPFGTIYADNIQSTGVDGQYVRLIGDTMSGPLGVANINSTGAFVLSGTSTVNMYGSQMAMQGQQITLQTDTGAIIIDGQTEIQSLINGATRTVVNTSGSEFYSNLYPDVSGTRTVGTPDRPFQAIYADYIVPTAVSGTGNFVLKIGDTMVGDLNFSSGIGIQLVQSGTSDIGSSASPLQAVYADNYYVGATPVFGAFVATSGGTMTGDLLYNPAGATWTLGAGAAGKSLALTSSSGVSISASSDITMSNAGDFIATPGSDVSFSHGGQFTVANSGGFDYTGSGQFNVSTGGSGTSITSTDFEVTTSGYGFYSKNNHSEVKGASGEYVRTSGGSVLLGAAGTNRLQISFSGATFSTNLVPEASGTRSVGEVSNPFSDLYVESINGQTATTQIYNEIPAEVADGINTVFYTTYAPYSNTARVYRAGLRQTPGGVDYTLAGSGITFAIAPISGDNILIDYERVLF